MKRGFTVLETLIGIVFSAGLILTIFQYSTLKGALSRRLDEKTARIALQQFVQKNIDCKAALYPGGANCADGTWLNVSDITGNPLAQGDSGTIKLGDKWALRIRCQQNPAPHLKVEYAKVATGVTPKWSELYSDTPLSCAPPAPPPTTTPGCTIANTSATFDTAQIAALLGIPAGDWVLDDPFHGHIICRKAAYTTFVSKTRKTGNTGCSGKKIHAWSKSNGAYAKVDACQSARHLETVTCQFRETGVCPCSAERELLVPGSINLVASHFSNVRFFSSFNFNCMGYPGTIYSYGGTRCPGIFSNQITRTKVCELLGYSNVVSYQNDSYSSCGNNSVAKWNSATNVFDLFGSCGSNQFIKDIKCSNPIAATCQTFY